MAKLLLVNLPATGHINPTLPLVGELVARGHDVGYAMPPAFGEICTSTGARLVPLGPEDAQGGPGSGAGNPIRLAAMLLEATVELLPPTIQAVEDERAELVLHDAMCPWGRLAAQRLGRKRICLSTSFALDRDLFKDLVGPWESARTLLGGVTALPRFARARRALTKAGATGLSVGELITNRGAPTLVFTAPEFQPGGGRAPERYFVGPSVVTSNQDEAPYLPEGDGPLVYASLGTVLHDQEAFYRTCLAMATATGVRLVMSVGSARMVEKLGPLPSHVRAFATVPQVALLPEAAAFITHGGLNSAHEGLLAEVPLIGCPQQLEQRAVTHRVADLGLGVELRSSPAAAELSHAVDRALAGEFAPALAQMAQNLRAAGGAAHAADMVEAQLA